MKGQVGERRGFKWVGGEAEVVEKKVFPPNATEFRKLHLRPEVGGRAWETERETKESP